jgi:hypothetical protein
VDIARCPGFAALEADPDDFDAPPDLPVLDLADALVLLDPADLVERAEAADRADLPRDVDLAVLAADFLGLADLLLLADFVLVPALPPLARFPAADRLAVGLRICPSLAGLVAQGPGRGGDCFARRCFAAG